MSGQLPCLACCTQYMPAPVIAELLQDGRIFQDTDKTSLIRTSAAKQDPFGACQLIRTSLQSILTIGARRITTYNLIYRRKTSPKFHFSKYQHGIDSHRG